MSGELTPEQIEALLDGTALSGSAEAWNSVSEVLASAKASPTTSEFHAEERVINGMVHAHHQSAFTPSLRGRINMKLGMTKTKLAAAIAGTALIGTTGLAYADVLPDSVQNATSKALENVGLHVPHRDSKQEDNDATEEQKNEADHPENHGADVSGVAKSTEPGPGHGKAVSDVARKNHGEETTGSSIEDHGKHKGRDKHDSDDGEETTGSSIEDHGKHKGRDKHSSDDEDETTTSVTSDQDDN